MDDPDQPAPAIAAAEEFPPFDPPELFEPDVPVAEPVPAPPPPKRGGRLVMGIIVAATATIIFLGMQNRRLQTRIDRLVSETAQQAELSAKPGGAKSELPLIIAAVYGSGAHFVDVTRRVNELLAPPSAEFHARPDFLKKDPVPGWNKQLVIIYEFHGQRQMFSTGEGGTVSLAALQEAK